MKGSKWDVESRDGRTERRIKKMGNSRGRGKEERKSMRTRRIEVKVFWRF